MKARPRQMVRLTRLKGDASSRRGRTWHERGTRVRRIRHRSPDTGQSIIRKTVGGLLPRIREQMICSSINQRGLFSPQKGHMTTTKGRLTVPISESRIAAAKSRAMEVYERTQCSGPGCCGDINGALDTMIRELAEVDTEELISSAVAMGRVAAAKDIDRMPNELGDEGWNTLARRAENAGYDRRMVLRRRRPEEGLTALTIEAAYQHGYRQASEVARGVTPSTGRAESADCCPTCDRARRDGVGLIPDGLGDLTQCDDSWHQD